MTKLALGIADNQAVTQVCEALGVPATPVVVFPRVNAAHASHPAWGGQLTGLRRAGVCVVDGQDLSRQPPPSAPDEFVPWAAIRAAIRAAVRPRPDP